MAKAAKFRGVVNRERAARHALVKRAIRLELDGIPDIPNFLADAISAAAATGAIRALNTFEKRKRHGLYA